MEKWKIVSIKYHRTLQKYFLLMKALVLSSLVTLVMMVMSYQDCVHDHFAHNTTKHFYNDLSESRQMQSVEEGRIRIFVDYTQVKVGGQSEINIIKRITNITATYFYNVLVVPRLSKLYYPDNTSRICNTLEIPEVYVKEGTIGDLAVVCGNQDNPSAVYVAKSTACGFLESTKRPIWGMMSWNNAYLKFDQEGFQQILFVGIHQMTHILGFSALMYELFPAGNLLVQDPSGDNYLSSPIINEEIKKHYGCENPKGFLLEDQDGTLIASHWEQKVIGNEFMIASNKKGSFMSRFTLALFESTGWYTQVNYTYAEPTVWGKGKGCNFFNIDDCNYPEFCHDSAFGCDWEATAIGRCSPSAFTGGCKVKKYFTNTICIDENYELKNLNSKLNAMERGGSSSKCFSSDFRQEGLKKTKLDNRCYISVCSFSEKFVYILVGSYILVCGKSGQVLKAPPGLEGQLICPSNFENYCKSKKVCPYHCNKNGACIDGQCLCTGSLELTPSCIDVSMFLAPVGSSGGLLNSLSDSQGNLEIDSNGQLVKKPKNNASFRKEVKQYSINSKCSQGTFHDQLFGECLKCRQVFNCEYCNESGCKSCDHGNPNPNNGYCPK